MLIQITAPHFVAGLDTDTGRVAPIIRYMSGWPLPKIEEFCGLKKWQCIIIADKGLDESFD